MAGSFINRLGDSPEEGIKAPVVAASNNLENLVLSGVQMVGGIQLEAGDRVLVRAQLDPVENGIYHVDDSAWLRTTDFNAADDVVNGVLVLDASDGDLFRAVFVGPYQPGITSVEFTLVASLTGGGLNPSDYIPIIGTAVSNPITGTLEFLDAQRNKNWRFGIVGASFNDFYMVDQIHDGNQAFNISVNNLITSFNSKGEVLVNTTYDVNTPGHALVTKQYVEDATGGAGGSFVPLAGTTPGNEITGTIEFDNATLGVQWGFGIAEGITDILTLGVTSDTTDPTGFLIVTGDGSGEQYPFGFGADGFLILPDIDYTNAPAGAAVPREWVESQGGGGGAFIPLVGTSVGNEVTGGITHVNIANNTTFTLGNGAIAGFEDGYMIAAGASSRPDSKIYFVTGAANLVSSIDETGSLNINNVNAVGNVICAALVTGGIQDTGGATIAGRATIGSATAQATHNLFLPGGLGGLAVVDDSQFQGRLVIGTAVDQTTYDLLVDGDVGISGDTVMGGLVTTGIQDTGGATFAGRVTIGSAATQATHNLFLPGGLGGLAVVDDSQFQGDLVVAGTVANPTYALFVDDSRGVGINGLLVVDGIVATGIETTGGAKFGGAIDHNFNRLINCADPLISDDAATRGWSDGRYGWRGAGNTWTGLQSFNAGCTSTFVQTNTLQVLGGGFPISVSAWAGGGTRLVRVDNNGGLYASAS